VYREHDQSSRKSSQFAPKREDNKNKNRFQTKNKVTGSHQLN
jgi:hypothetical protein